MRHELVIKSVTSSSNQKHRITIDNVQVLACEEHTWKRRIREAIKIRTQQPTLNRETGYDLPAIYNNLLSHNRPSKGGHVTGKGIYLSIYIIQGIGNIIRGVRKAYSKHVENTAITTWYLCDRFSSSTQNEFDLLLPFSFHFHLKVTD